MGTQMTEMLKGTLEGIVLAILAALGIRLRDHGMATGAGLHRHRRRHDLRPARPAGAETAGRCGEGPFREGPAAQGVHPQPEGARPARRVLEDLELPRRTNRTAPHRMQNERTEMAEEVVRDPHRLPGTEEAVQAGQSPPRRPARALPHDANAFQRYLMYQGASPTATRRSHVRRLRRPVGARCADRTPVREISATTRSTSPRPSPRRTAASDGSTRNARG